MKTILLIEDDKNLSESLCSYLQKEKFIVHAAYSLSDALVKLQNKPDIIILDWMLPDGQGIDFIYDYRQSENSVSVILLTAKVDLIDRVTGLESGADDYLTKPFEPRELLARIRARMRDKSSTQEKLDLIEFSDISVRPSLREASYKGKILELTKLEFDLLYLLVQNPKKVFPREALLNQVWGYDNFPTTRTIDNHIVQLRQKTNPEMFETIRGVGYRIRETKK